MRPVLTHSFPHLRASDRVATSREGPKADRAKLRTDEGLREVRDSLVGQVKAELQKATDGKAHTLPPLYYFRLHREYDRTGTFCFGEDCCLSGVPSQPLKPDTAYIALLATLVVDDPFADDRNVANTRLAKKLPEPAVWTADLVDLSSNCCHASFRKIGRENV